MHTKKSWREFQTDYLTKKKRKHLLFSAVKRSAVVLSLLLLVAAIGLSAINHFTPDRILPQSAVSRQDLFVPEAVPRLSQIQLSQIISATPFTRSSQKIHLVETPENNYTITTSIDPGLQEYLLSRMDRLKTITRGKPQRIALVAMEADSGKIIAMTGFDLDDPDANPCVEADYPAASIFKIITAAAAVETLGYTPQTQLYFNGNKYTLYKRQLTETRNKYSYQISFSRAFAESINPVFGKLGQNLLGKETLESYADAFGFNQAVNADISFSTGSFATNDIQYHLAELGSGFNTDTLISPVFGAMMTAAVINSGHVMQPSIVEQVTGTTGDILYENIISPYKTAIMPETAQTMMQLMQKTVTLGTASKSFRGASKDPVLSRLIIGGKTGSLYNKSHTVKYDWFTGFGTEKNGNRKIIVSVVVGHRKYIGTRAGTYAKMILKQYFKDHHDTTAQL